MRTRVILMATILIAFAVVGGAVGQTCAQMPFPPPTDGGCQIVIINGKSCTYCCFGGGGGCVINCTP